MKGFQFLENDFFVLCRTRKIKPIPILLYIYLRGAYCRFQNSEFFYKDKQIEEHLGLNHKALQRARLILQEKGTLKFIPGKGSNYTTYHMLATVLMPDGMDKKPRPCGQNLKKGMDTVSTPINTSNERVKNRIGVFPGMTEEERKNLITKGLL